MNSDIKAGLTAFTIGLVYLAASFSASGSNMVISTPIQPTLFPRIISAGLIISSLSILIPALIKKKRRVIEEKEEIESFFTKERKIVLLSYVIYVALFNILGYKISTFIFSMGILSYLNGRKWKRNLSFSLIFVLTAYYVFSNTLQIQLPIGFFGI